MVNSKKIVADTRIGRTAGLASNNPGDFRIADASLSVNAAAVPEPVSIALLGTGLLGMGAVRRRRAGK